MGGEMREFQPKAYLIYNVEFGELLLALSSVHDRLGTLSPEAYAPLMGIAADLRVVNEVLKKARRVEYDDTYCKWREV